MKNVRVGFSTNKQNWFSNLIREVSNSPVSHAFLVVDWNGTDVLVEAHWNGLRVIDFKQWSKKDPPQLVALFEPKTDLNAAFGALIPYLGQPYDFAGLIGMGIVYLGRWLSRKWANPWHSHNALFCSEVVAQLLQWSSYPGWNVAEAKDVSPDDLYDFFLKDADLVFTPIV